MISKIKNKIYSDKNLLELIKGGSVSFIFQIFGIGLSYLFILLISRFYGAEGMGIFALSFTVLNIFVLFGKFGLDVSSIKFIGERYEQKEYSHIKDIYLKILYLVIPINIILTILLFIIAPYLAEYVFKKPTMTIYFQLVSLGVLPMSLRFIHANAIRGMKNIKVFSFLQNITMYLFALFLLIILYLFTIHNNTDPLIALLFGLFVGALLSIYFWLKESNFFLNKKVFSLQVKEILSVSAPLLLSSSIMLILGLADTVMLGMLKSESDVGIYNVAYKIATVAMIVFIAMSSIATPKIAAVQDDQEKLRRIVLQTTKLIVIVSLPMYFIIFVFSEQLLSLFGEEFKQGSLALILITIGFLVKSLLGTSEYVLQMTNQQKSLIFYALISAIINIVLNYFLIPIFDIEGAAFASMFSIIIYQLMITIKVQTNFHILFYSGIKK